MRRPCRPRINTYIDHAVVWIRRIREYIMQVTHSFQTEIIAVNFEGRQPINARGTFEHVFNYCV